MSEPTPVRLVDLRETPLDVDEVVAALEDETSGGLTLFVGRVRDHDHGKGVLGLDYTAHPSALGRLREVCERVAAAYDVHGVAAVHRVGSLDIGDVAGLDAEVMDRRAVGDAVGAIGFKGHGDRVGRKRTGDGCAELQDHPPEHCQRAHHGRTHHHISSIRRHEFAPCSRGDGWTQERGRTSPCLGSLQ